MDISTSTPAAIATKVWAQASRKLTGFGSMISGPIQTAQATIAVGLSVDLRASTSANFREVTVAMASTSTGQSGLYDGTNFIVGPNVNNSTAQANFFVGGSTVGARIFNSSGTTALTVMYAYNEWVF